MTITSSFVDYISKNWIALAAIILGIANFVHTFYIGRRDKSKLMAKSLFIPNYDFIGEDYIIQIEAVNAGRRPIVLTGLVILYDNREKLSVLLEPNTPSITLAENQKFRIPTNHLDAILGKNPKGLRAIKLWFKDTLGRLYAVRGAEMNLFKYYESAETNPPTDFRL